MRYSELKFKKGAEKYSSASLYGRILIRVVIVGLLVLGVVKGCDGVMTMAKNAPVEEWKLKDYQNLQMRSLIDMKHRHMITQAQFDSLVAYWGNKDNATKEYKDERYK